MNEHLYFQPMGLHLHIETNHPAIVAAARASFGGFGSGDATASPDIHLYLFAHEWCHDVTHDDGPPKQPIYRTQGALIYQSTGRDSTLVADRERGLAYGYFSPSVLANPAFFRWHFLELAFFTMLEHRGIMGVHGAAVVKSGRAILLRAKSGGGKTTLAYAAARQKFQALAEDVVWLDLNKKQWWGTPWHFHLLPDAKHLFSELALYQPTLQTNGEMKLEVNLHDIRPNSTTPSAQPGPIVLVERMSGQASQIHPLALNQAMPLWLASYAGSEKNFPDYTKHIEALLDNKVYHLAFGDDIAQAVMLLETIL